MIIKLCINNLFNEHTDKTPHHPSASSVFSWVVRVHREGSLDTDNSDDRIPKKENITSDAMKSNIRIMRYNENYVNKTKNTLSNL